MTTLFDGITYDPKRDGVRLTAQLAAVKTIMLDHDWHTIAGIAASLNAPEASVSARLRDLRKAKFGAYIVERSYVSDGLWQYRLVERTSPVQEPLPW